jgi:hypothetical protein
MNTIKVAVLAVGDSNTAAGTARRRPPDSGSRSWRRLSDGGYAATEYLNGTLADALARQVH